MKICVSYRKYTGFKFYTVNVAKLAWEKKVTKMEYHILDNASFINRTVFLQNFSQIVDVA